MSRVLHFSRHKIDHFGDKVFNICNGLQITNYDKWMADMYSNPLFKQEAFEKCWAHSPLRAAARRIAIHQVLLLSHAATVASRLRIDVHNNDDDDNNDNA